MKGISIIICCYNSAERLPETLYYLARQVCNADLFWEVIIVDNNSNDDTEQIALRELNRLNTPAHYKVVKEANAGLNYARAKGIEEAAYEYVIFCDDDNWLFPDYVSKAYELMTGNAEIGVAGGVGIPAWENEMNTFKDYAGYFATGALQEQSGDVTYKTSFVYGAGMIMSKTAWRKIHDDGFKFFTLDRAGKSLSSGGDNEICYNMIFSGFKIWFSTDLQFYHFIPASRSTEQYLLKLNYAYGQTTAYVKPYVDCLKNRNLKMGFARYYFSDLLVRFYELNRYALVRHLNVLRSFPIKMRLHFYKGYFHTLLFNRQAIHAIYNYTNAKSKFLGK